MKEYIAHRSEETGQTQTVYEHLAATARLAAEFAAPFGGRELGYRCGLLHDIGKYSAEFQKRILENGDKVNHSTAGAKEAFAARDLNSAFCIAGHHGGLPDGGNQGDTSQTGTLMGRLKRIPGKEIPVYADYQTEISIPPARQPDYAGESRFSQSFFIRMLFSSLVDADFLDTETFMTPGQVERGGYASMQSLLERLERHIAPWWQASSSINEKRCSILRTALEGGSQAPGMFTLTVPTGGGKTVSSMAFALRHAAAHEKRRIIYVIPYNSIIEQTVQVFSDIFGEDQVIAHYTNADYGEEEGDGSPRKSRMRLATENWDAPIIVTTAVQFFESLFANKSSRCRKLHNLADSILIFDEAQMLPTPYLRPCLAAVSQLVTHYGGTAVLCTATQPALEPILKEFLPEFAVRELCPDRQELYQFFRRVRYVGLGVLDTAALARRLNDHHQVLCIVNSRKQVQEVFCLLEGEGSFHLSTLMTPLHRRVILAEIRERLKAGLPCRVVSTCLIEAGVDVDFPTVYRAQCGLDSLIQAGGRCNRENKRPRDESVVYWFATQDPPPPAFTRNIAAAKAVMEQGGELDAPETVSAYFALLLYRLMGPDALDEKQILDAFERGIQGNLMPFSTVAQQFRLIESNAVTVYVPMGEGGALIKQLKEQGASRGLLRKLGGYGVSVYPEHFRRLFGAGAVELVDGELVVLTDMSLYGVQTGLTLAPEEGKALIL